jgi:hypothetical protein
MEVDEPNLHCEKIEKLLPNLITCRNEIVDPKLV